MTVLIFGSSNSISTQNRFVKDSPSILTLTHCPAIFSRLQHSSQT